MTNEERIEERLMHAYQRGYYDKVITRVTELKTNNPKIDHYEAFELACTESKQEWLKSNEEDGSQF
jgi:hypothetical protein